MRLPSITRIRTWVLGRVGRLWSQLKLLATRPTCGLGLCCGSDVLDDEFSTCYELCRIQVYEIVVEKAARESGGAARAAAAEHTWRRPGEPGKGRRRVAHAQRPVVKSSWPVHVTVRMRSD